MNERPPMTMVAGLTIFFASIVLMLVAAAGYPTTSPDDVCSSNIEGAAHGEVFTSCADAPFCDDYCQGDKLGIEERCMRALRAATPHYEEGCER